MPLGIPMWREPFGGSFAIALRLYDAQARPPSTYQGGKMMLADATLRAAGYKPGQGAGGFSYNEASPAVFAGVQGLSIHSPERLGEEVARISPGRPGYDSILALPAQPGSAAWTAQFWALQACAPHGKPPRWDDGSREWRTSGYATVSPAGIRRGFKERLNPEALRPKVEAASELLQHMPVEYRCGGALHQPIQTAAPGSVVYLDPPYKGCTGYQRAASRADVISLALRYQAAGWRVLFAEAEPVEIPGAYPVQLTRADGRPLPRGRQEWLTILEPT